MKGVDVIGEVINDLLMRVWFDMREKTPLPYLIFEFYNMIVIKI